MEFPACCVLRGIMNEYTRECAQKSSALRAAYCEYEPEFKPRKRGLNQGPGWKMPRLCKGFPYYCKLQVTLVQMSLR